MMRIVCDKCKKEAGADLAIDRFIEITSEYVERPLDYIGLEDLSDKHLCVGCYDKFKKWLSNTL